MTEPVLHSSHLFTLSLTVDPNFTDVGETPYGRRRIATVTGGTFEGEELKGTVLPAPGRRQARSDRPGSTSWPRCRPTGLSSYRQGTAR